MNNAQPLRVLLLEADGAAKAEDSFNDFWWDNAGPMPIEHGRRHQKHTVKRLIGDALLYHTLPVPEKGAFDYRPLPKHSATITPTGLGKSEEYRRGTAEFVIEQKRRHHPLDRAANLVPTHRLAEEARSKMAAMEAQGVRAAIWQSRQAKDLDTGEPLCKNLEAVKAAYAVGADVQRTACVQGRGKKKVKCPFYDACAFQKQDAMAKQAHVVFAAQDLLWHGLGAFGKGFGLCVVDEGFFQKGLITKPNETRIRLDTLDVLADWNNYPVNSEEGGNKMLRDIVKRFQAIFTDRADGPLTKKELIAARFMMAPDDSTDADLDFHSFARAVTLEWRRKVKSGIRPDTSATDRVAMVEACKFISTIRRRSALWHSCDDFVNDQEPVSGRISLVTVMENGKQVRYIQVLRKKQVHASILVLPIIHGDATMPVELVKHFLPQLFVELDIQVTSPHATTTQITGLAVGKSILSNKGKHAASQPARLERLRALITKLARGRRTLVVCQMDVEPAFAGMPNVVTGHFGAIEGLDCFGDVEILVTIGRPMPSPHDVELMMSALTGKPVAIGGMVSVQRAVRLKGGATETMKKVSAYADRLADQALNAIAVAAVVQALGRARGVNRTAANPVEMYAILHDLVLPIEIDATVNVKAIEPDEIDAMLARGLLAEWPLDAMKFHPDLFKTVVAAKYVYRGQHSRVAALITAYSAFIYSSPSNAYSEITHCSARPERGVGKTAIIESLYSEITHCSTLCRFKPRGAGQKFRRALVSSALVPTARELIEAALGPLAVFEIITDHHPLEPAPPSRGGRGLPLVWGKPGSNLAARLAAQAARPSSRPQQGAQQLRWRGPATRAGLMASGP